MRGCGYYVPLPLRLRVYTVSRINCVLKFWFMGKYSDEPASSKYNYSLLKAELLATASHQQKHSSKSFWEHQKSSGSTWWETANTLIKKVRLFTPGPTIEDVRSQHGS